MFGINSGAEGGWKMAAETDLNKFTKAVSARPRQSPKLQRKPELSGSRVSAWPTLPPLYKDKL